MINTNIQYFADSANKTAKKKDETVTVRLFKSKDPKYSQPVRVYINGKGYAVPRGIEVKVPKAVAEVLANKERQEGQASSLIDSLVSEQ